MNYQRELLKGNTDSLLLYLLICQPMYGYQIIKELEKRSEGYLPNGQERRYYTITEKGIRDYSQRLEDWKSFARAINAVIQPTSG